MTCAGQSPAVRGSLLGLCIRCAHWDPAAAEVMGRPQLLPAQLGRSAVWECSQHATAAPELGPRPTN